MQDLSTKLCQYKVLKKSRQNSFRGQESWRAVTPGPVGVELLHSLHCTFEIVSTEEGTFNFWALEVTELRESSLLLYFCRIN